MKVLKFGGTSVGTVESLSNVKRIVESRTEPVIVVVSALGGITDQLINTARAASLHNMEFEAMHAAIVRRHADVIAGIVAEEFQEEVHSIVDPLLDELGNLYRAINLLGELTPRALDIIVSYGERISSVIVSRVINGAKLVDSRSFIKTERQFGKHVLDNDATQKRIAETFAGLEYDVIVAPGFISSDAKGDVTNLGRGGSDYTAAILAAALDADTLEIWTDVNGFMTADPRIICDAYVIDKLSFIEAMELCNCGAKVIYPPTIYPVFHKNIPIYIKNTFNPEAPGTRISDDAQTEAEKKALKGISSISDTCLITVAGRNVADESARIFNEMARNGVGVFLISQSADNDCVSFAVRNADAEVTLGALREEFATEIQNGVVADIAAREGLATVAVIGEEMKQRPEVTEGLYGILESRGVAVVAGAPGASELNMSFVVELDSLKDTIAAIHDIFFVTKQS